MGAGSHSKTQDTEGHVPAFSGISEMLETLSGKLGALILILDQDLQVASTQ